MIVRVQFENFKSLQNVTLELGRLTALVGANGCGKSSVLQGIDLLSRCASPPDVAELSHKIRPEIPPRMSYRGGGSMTLAMVNGNDEELKAERRVLVERRLTAERGVPPEQVLGEWKVQRPLTAPREFASIVYLHLDANEMIRTSVTEDEHPRMAANGGGLASALAWMKGAAEEDLAKLTDDLRQIVPGVKRIRTLRERVSLQSMEKLDIDGQPVWRPVTQTPIGDRFAIEFDHGSEVPADLLSEGTVLALGLLTKLREPERPQLLLIDDIDRGLHLGAQVELMRVLRNLISLDPELQIVCTTHSPYLLDLFEPSEIRVLALDSERRTHARPLTDHPDFGKWKFGTQTGELWAALGEAWVVDRETAEPRA
jgi:energy-coupling factor transporter ATP-binding protein EcfA2